MHTLTLQPLLLSALATKNIDLGILFDKKRVYCSPSPLFLVEDSENNFTVTSVMRFPVFYTSFSF